MPLEGESTGGHHAHVPVRRGHAAAQRSARQVRVLHLEASARDSSDVEQALRRRFDVVEFLRVETAAAFDSALDGHPWDLVLADPTLPGLDGHAALAAIKASGEDLPLVALSGAGGPGLADDIMRAGARDCLVKGDLERLNAVVERELDDAARRRAEAERRLQAGEELEASEARYRRLFEAAKDGILILDAVTGEIVEVNPFMLELTGYARADFLGRHLWEIGPFKDIAASQASFAALLANAYVRYEDLPLLARDGHKVAVEFISNVYRVAGKDVIQCNVRDISARKSAEREHRELEARLRMSQRMEAVGSLAGGVAHDFNNLLSVILNFTAFAREAAPPGGPQEADLLEVKKAAERATVLTRQLLAFGRKQVLAPVLLDLNEVARGVERMLQRVLGEDVELVQSLAPGLGAVRADPGQMEQVLMNLVVNARDAMPEGGTLTMETSNLEVGPGEAAGPGHPPQGSWVRLTVTDTGCGMDEATRARAFEPFYTTKEFGKGTGLGLSVTYGIVEQSGGSIRVESAPGKGARFEVLLPRDHSPVTAAEPQAPAAAPLTGTETVLVVEDEPALRLLLERTLQGAGFTVLLAPDGDSALRTSGGHDGEIQLLLTDVVMPRMGGRAVAEALGPGRPDMKVLYMSGYPDDGLHRHGGLAPGAPLLAKPFTATGLVRKVRDVLDGCAGEV